MNLKEKLKKAWENKTAIAEGFYNTYISHDKEIQEEADRRLAICESNVCGYWDSTGQSDKLVMKGSPGCTGCGCNGKMKVNCMACYCYLKDIGETPLWDSLITEDMDKEINTVQYRKQFEKK